MALFLIIASTVAGAADLRPIAAEGDVSASGLYRLGRIIQEGLSSHLSEFPSDVVIEPIAMDLRYIGGSKRFWSGILSGSSHVVLRMKITRGRNFTEKVFQDESGAWKGSLTVGRADRKMIDRIAEQAINYVMQRPWEEFSQETQSSPVNAKLGPEDSRKAKGYAAGTGFFVSSDGVLVTDFGVVEGARDIQVYLASGPIKATILRLDPANGVAVLKVDAATKALHLSDARDLQKAEAVMAVSYPQATLDDQEQQAAFGRVNALSGNRNDVRFIQIDVPVQEGSAGAPLISDVGDVVGVVANLATSGEPEASNKGASPFSLALKCDYLFPLLPSQPATASGPHRSFPEILKSVEGAVVRVIAR